MQVFCLCSDDGFRRPHSYLGIARFSVKKARCGRVREPTTHILVASHPDSRKPELPGFHGGVFLPSPSQNTPFDGTLTTTYSHHA